MKNYAIKLFSPSFNNKEINAAVKTLKSHNWASGAGLGKVLEFENNFRKYTHSRECVAVDSGTAALHLALKILDINEKEVLVPSLTFVTTVHSILYNGGIPIFVDVDPDTLCLDPADIETKITKNTKAIVPVHFGGYPCDMNKIINISKERDVHIIEDAAHACGSSYNSKKIGAISELTCFSFHPVKNLSMPKGGAITINSRNSHTLRKKLNSLRWCGIDNRKGTSYDVTSLGYNYYSDEISAAIGIEQLKKLDSLNLKRFHIAQRYDSELKTSEKIPLSKECSYHLYWIRVKNRNQFIKKINSHGIEIGLHYRPVHSMSFYNSKISLPNTEKSANEIVTIPVHPNLTDHDVDFIIKTVNLLSK
ncbi:MAG: DegT/DnrJ/EryC1/StrS family aminotransferase [Nitrosotalea sp.]